MDLSAYLEVACNLAGLRAYSTRGNGVQVCVYKKGWNYVTYFCWLEAGEVRWHPEPGSEIIAQVAANLAQLLLVEPPHGLG